MAPGLADGAIIMDTGSVKLFPIKVISQYLPLNVSFVPAHPIAGGEQSGISAGRADLLHKKQVIVTPSEPLSGDLLRKVTSFWNFLGARVEGMPPDIHDYLYAHISHLPQLLAFATKEIVQSTPNDEMMMRFTRLQKSNRKLWTEIFLLNNGPVLAALDRYLDVITHIKSELQQAPDEGSNDNISTYDQECMFARITASALVTTIMEAEKKNGFSFARYAGGGLRDFNAPVENPPEPH
jgi:cyclohexadieny/prephenate dehydrogenase